MIIVDEGGLYEKKISCIKIGMSVDTKFNIDIGGGHIDIE
jgi:hypothetical protein